MKPSFLLSTPRFALARDAFVNAYGFSRKWDRMVRNACKRYGDRHSTPISGIYSDHFPIATQTRLRNVARQVSSELDRAWKLFPARTRFGTKMDLKNAVISRDGRGFYG